MKMRNQMGNRNGSALLLSLWALLVLSVAVFALAKYVNQEIDAVREGNLGLDAKALAHSGLTVALHPLVSQRTPLLVADFGQGRGYRVRIIGEGGKLDINKLLEGEQRERLDLLRSYLRYRGLKPNESQRLIDCMLDWVDPDNIKHLNGCEDDGDYHPANRPFRSVDEIAKVKGAGPLVSQPHWQDDLTIYGDGTIDVQSASLAVLSLLQGVGEARARQFIQIRRGRDKVDGTLDDHIFKQEEVSSFLGISQQNQSQPAVTLGVVSTYFRIISIGTSGKVDRQVEVVAQKVPGNPNILLWKEN